MSTVTDTSSSPLFDDSDSRKDEMEQTIETWVEDLVDAVQDAEDSEEFEQWLKIQSEFHSYSYKNSLLIMKQCPGATRVAGYRTWQDEFNRHVKEGESAIWIWRPNTFTGYKCPHCGNAPSYHSDNESLSCPLAGDEPSDWDFDPEEEWTRGEILMGFSPAPVFDVSQTEGEELPSLDYAAQGNPGNLIPSLTSVAEEFSVTIDIVSCEDWDRESDGVCRYNQGNDGKHAIEVRDRENKADLASVIVHEIAHAELHSDVDESIERSKREVEAESVAYIVGRHFGFDMSGSAFYLAAWKDDDADVIEQRLTRISNTAEHIIETLEQDC